MNLEVLVVDDYDMVQFLHKEILSMGQITSTPHLFSDGKKALDFLIENKRPGVEYLVLLDLNMPIMNGYTFLSNLGVLEYKENVHVVIVSSSIDDYDKKQATSFPYVIDFIEKPLRFKDCERIKKLDALQKHFFNSSAPFS